MAQEIEIKFDAEQDKKNLKRWNLSNMCGINSRI